MTHQCDVKRVFLDSPIGEEVYLEQPQEFAKQGLDGGKLICRLKKINFLFETGN